MISTKMLTILTDLIKDSNDPFWSDAELYRYLTMGQNKVMSKIVEMDQNFFEYTEYVSYVADQEQYDLPTDIFMGKLICAEYVDSQGNKSKISKIKKSSRNDYAIRSGTYNGLNYATPVYYLTGMKICFLPIPTSTEANKVLLTYVQELDDIDAGTDSGLPSAFHNLVIYEAALIAKSKDDDDLSGIQLLKSEEERIHYRAVLDRAHENPTFIQQYDSENEVNPYVY